MNARAADPGDAIAALERLYHKKVVTLEEAQAATRYITGDENATFPPPKPPAPEPPAAPATAAAPEPEAAPAPPDAAPTETDRPSE